ncbi:MarR family winged helix-turn-helix transcriptional regulator [Solidesulfovibrio magneticus]|uniref:MarR family transcriptional regulator n=1 Tax=Solidesulfovibrio magneticus (strain ATCC 700980 / DSM 13731 / RS-1) TaxID=573370 RepID=C4XNB9_SOLM1|nr:MarR family transcriptional regulator [Solidesulfovibrio magneticus]BAH77422.1 MarR family transcriptional regulator [Solidesulfovibrio magneticus RS-1]
MSQTTPPPAHLGHKGNEPHLLREIIRTHQMLVTGFSRKIGQPAARVALMRLLATASEPVGIMDLARNLGVNAAAVTRQIKELEAQGLVERCDDPQDGRRSWLRLSPQGMQLFMALHERSHALEKAFAAAVGPDNVRTAVEVLTQLRDFLDAFPNDKAL